MTIHKLINITAVFSALFFLTAKIALALPTMESEYNQDYSKNSAPIQMHDIVITEDSVENYITAGYIKIIIPDSIAIIFDTTKTADGITIFGPAVDSGKVQTHPEVTFENGDRTVIIPIEADLETDESFTITKLFAEGFNTQSGSSSNLMLQINEEPATYLDSKTLFVQGSSTDDTNSPDKPTNLVVSDHENGAILTWTDPTDLDIYVIHVMQGKNNLPVDGGNFETVAPGVQEFIRTDVVEGDTVKFVLRATDGLNLSAITEEVSFVIGTGTTAPEEPPVEPEVPVDPEPPVEPEVPVEPETPITDETLCMDYSDLPADYVDCEAVTYVTENGIFEGYPDGTFGSDEVINRAETVKVIANGFGLTILEDDGTNLGFSDVIIGEWYVPYLLTAKEAGIIQGYPNGTFKPEQTVNYVEMLKVFFETADVELNAMGAEDQWYQPYLTYAQNNDYIEYTDLTSGMKRIDVAKMFYHLSSL